MGGELAFVGLGLYGVRGLTLEALEYLRRADVVYLEVYTSVLPGLDIEALSRLIGREVKVVDRGFVEGEGALEMIERAARGMRVVLATPGDPFVATTHIAIRVEAERRGVKTRAIPAPSVINAVIAATGLQIYKFGRAVTIVYPQREFGYVPSTPYYVLKENLERGLHTLFFLDVRNRRGMTAPEAAGILIELEEREGIGIIGPDTLAVALARLGSPTELVAVDVLGRLRDRDLGAPPHTLVVPGLLHPMEVESLEVLAGADRGLLESWNQRLRRGLRGT